MAQRKDKTSISLPEALIKRLDRLAKAAGSSRSELIRELIEDGLDQQETMIRATSDPVLMGAFGRALSDPDTHPSSPAAVSRRLHLGRQRAGHPAGTGLQAAVPRRRPVFSGPLSARYVRALVHSGLCATGTRGLCRSIGLLPDGRLAFGPSQRPVSQSGADRLRGRSGGLAGYDVSRAEGPL